jgi:hypothetical protein
MLPIKLHFFPKTDLKLEKPYHIKPLTFSFTHYSYKITILDKIILINNLVVNDIAKIINQKIT